MKCFLKGLGISTLITLGIAAVITIFFGIGYLTTEGIVKAFDLSTRGKDITTFCVFIGELVILMAIPIMLECKREEK